MQRPCANKGPGNMTTVLPIQEHKKNNLAQWPGGLFEMHVWLLGILGLAGCKLQGNVARPAC